MTKCTTCDNYHEGACLYGEDIPAHGLQPEAGAVEPPPPPKPEEARIPQPPQQFAATFLPLLEGVRQGIAARLQLLELTEYCISLEIALGEMERRHLTTAVEMLANRDEASKAAN